MTTTEAFELLVNVTGQIQLNRASHDAINEALALLRPQETTTQKKEITEPKK